MVFSVRGELLARRRLFSRLYSLVFVLWHLSLDPITAAVLLRRSRARITPGKSLCSGGGALLGGAGGVVVARGRRAAVRRLEEIPGRAWDGVERAALVNSVVLVRIRLKQNRKGEFVCW